MVRRTGAVDASGSGVPLALTYTRVSSDEQANSGTSLDAQTRECRRYVAERGWVLKHEYSDVLSGRRTDRPDYQRLLQHVRQLRSDRQPVVVVVAALDRFGRRVLERVRCREELKQLGVPTHSVREGGEVSDLVANVLASVAEEEVARIGMRVSAAWTNLAGQGWFKVSAMLPWGYRSRPATSDERAGGSPKTVIEPDPIAAPHVAELFTRAAAGESTWSVAKWAAALPAEVRGRWVSGRGSTPDRELTRRSVSKILRNDVYVAPPPARWQAIVDPATWAAVQRRMDATREAPRAKPAQYRLTGFLACPNCGSRMSGEQSGPYRRYRCQAWRAGGSSTIVCNVSVDASQVESLTISQVSERIGAFIAMDRSRLERAWARRAQPDKTLADAKLIRRFEQQAETARRRITRATQLFVDDQIEKEAYDSMVATEQSSLVAADKDLQRVNGRAELPSLPPLNQVLAALPDWARALEVLDNVALRDILALLVEQITPQRVSRGVYATGIRWTPLGDMLRSDLPIAV